MKNPDNQLRGDYEWQFCVKAQPLIELRRSNVTISFMAHKLGVSEKSIQRFEKLKLMDSYYLYAYKTILKYEQTTDRH